jgi:hypothetical protein
LNTQVLHRSQCARKRSAEAWSAGDPIGFLQAARTLAGIKKSEKPAEHRYKLSSAEIAVVTGRHHSKAAAPMFERGTFATCRRTLKMSAYRGRSEVVGAWSK